MNAKIFFRSIATMLVCVFISLFGGCISSPVSNTGEESSFGSSSESSSQSEEPVEPTKPSAENPAIISFLGDSITLGAPLEDRSNRYSNVLDAEEEYVVYNYGKSGTTIADTHDPEYKERSFTKRYLEINKDSDVIFVFGGTNDYGEFYGGIPLGEKGDDTIATFYGGLNVLTDGLQENYPNAKLFYITPLKRDNAVWGYPIGERNEAGYLLEDYRNAIVTVCEERGIGYLDLFNADMPPSYLTDGLHPGIAGHIIVANYIKRFLETTVYPELNQGEDYVEESKNHEKLYYYGENNVPYDGENVSYGHCFITPYLAEKPTGGALVVFPGGDYTYLTSGERNQGEQFEAGDVAAVYNAKGISVFIVNYRVNAYLPTLSINYQTLLSDATRAMKYVRYNAEKFHIHPDKIGTLGFSAGGHLAALMLVESGYSWRINDADYIPDEIDSVSAKANAGVFGYSMLSFDDDATLELARKTFTQDDESLYELYAPDKQVTADTAPCFIWYQWYDEVLSNKSSRNFEKALKKAGVPFETHFYQETAPETGLGSDLHGMGLAHTFKAGEWSKLCISFLQGLGF